MRIEFKCQDRSRVAIRLLRFLAKEIYGLKFGLVFGLQQALRLTTTIPYLIYCRPDLSEIYPLESGTRTLSFYMSLQSRVKVLH